jgi:hypothetical protein
MNFFPFIFGKRNYLISMQEENDILGCQLLDCKIDSFKMVLHAKTGLEIC